MMKLPAPSAEDREWLATVDVEPEALPVALEATEYDRRLAAAEAVRARRIEACLAAKIAAGWRK
jgi:hypothetical protein